MITTVTAQFLQRSFAEPSPILSSHYVYQKLLENYNEKAIVNNQTQFRENVRSLNYRLYISYHRAVQKMQDLETGE